jgi:Cdc6-like AAA superfamily ATPase
MMAHKGDDEEEARGRGDEDSKELAPIKRINEECITRSTLFVVQPQDRYLSLGGASRGLSETDDDDDGHQSVVSEMTSDTSTLHHLLRMMKHNVVEPSTHHRMFDPKNVTKLSFDKVGLVGRDTQIQQIIDAYQNSVVNEKKRVIITLMGQSGVGKTSLANQAVEAVTSSTKACIQAGGKWSVSDHNYEPLSVLVDIIHQIAQQIREDECHSDLKERILKEFVNEPETISTWMPELLTTEERADMERASNIDNSNRHNGVSIISKFSKARVQYTTTTIFSLVDCPLVLTLDDVQWADETTLDLVRQCAVESSTSQMLLLLCCRSDGVGDSSRLVESFLKPILSDSEACQVQEIRLEQLTMKQTKEFMTMLLSVSPSEPETTNLANFLHRSTAGNPFYLVSFVQSLVDNALLSFDLGASTWVWDLNEIKMTTTITDNVVDVVKKKLMRSKEARSLLPIAATLGAEFSDGTLASICAAISGTKPPLLHKMGLWAMPLPSEMKSWLCACEEDGFLNHIQVKNKDKDRER